MRGSGRRSIPRTATARRPDGGPRRGPWPRSRSAAPEASLERARLPHRAVRRGLRRQVDPARAPARGAALVRDDAADRVHAAGLHAGAERDQARPARPEGPETASAHGGVGGAEPLPAAGGEPRPSARALAVGDERAARPPLALRGAP